VLLLPGRQRESGVVSIVPGLVRGSGGSRKAVRSMRRNRTVLAAALFLAGVLILWSGLEAAFAQPVITARLRAVPENFSGRCPAKIRFDGVIMVRNNTRPPLRVQYRFLRSDGALSPISTIVFDGNGSKNVSTTWTLGGPSLSSYSGWQSIKILYPQEAESNRANFSVACQAEPPRKPDLVIRSFGLKEWGKCEPNHVIFTFQVTVANIGSAPSPAVPGKAMVQAMDQHGNGWGNGVVLNAIPPGGHQTVVIPVYYLKNDPGHITGAAPHPFRAIADPLKFVDELREDNNLSGVINVDPRSLCRTADIPGTTHPLTEDCIAFNPATAQVKFLNNDWKIVDGNHWMFSFGNKKTEAEQALRVIKHYRVNQSCFVGRPGPSFQYLLRSGAAPSGAMAGEDCVSFNPNTAEVKKISNDWKIVDGSHWMFSFGSKEDEARQALAIIKKYGFTRSCFVGRPNASFQYMRK